MNPRGYFWLGILGLIGLAARPSAAVDVSSRSVRAYDRLLLPGEARDGLGPGARMQGARAETTWFGLYEVIDGEFYAIPSSDKEAVAWTFDHGIGPQGVPGRIDGGEGWREADLAAQDGTFFRVIDDSLDLGEGVPPPILSGERSLWVGMDAPGARAGCWDCAAGYGNAWLQRVTSPPLEYDGSGDVALRFLYFQNSEPCYDGTQVYLAREDGTWLLLNPTLECPNNPLFEGGFTDRIGDPFTPALYERTILAAEIGGAQAIQLVIEFTSDGGWSDEDGDYCTPYGPFGMDDVTIQGSGIDAFYDFETGLQGWVPSIPPSSTGIAGIAPADCYTILDPCQCRLAGNILEMHEGECDAGTHPGGQHTQIESPICVLGEGRHDVIFEWEMYVGEQLGSVALFRGGFRYFPYICPATGESIWSDPVSPLDYDHLPGPICARSRLSAHELVPPDAERVTAIFEILSDCEAFAIDPCEDVLDPTPLLDNLVIGVMPSSGAPKISSEIGGLFQDTGSYPSNLFDLRASGPADAAYRKYLSDPARPDRRGDSLVVAGPLPGTDPNTRWEARLFWRVARRAPFQADRENGAVTRYKLWKDRVGDGRAIDRPYQPEFTSGWMDSVQVGPSALRNKFKSEFRENDDDFAGQGNPENEMIWDDVLRPGTRIEYFIASNYVPTPGEMFLYPDTTGGNAFEFEVLPGIRVVDLDDCGGAGFDFCAAIPATLYIDAYDRGAQPFIENALSHVLNGEPLCTDPPGCAIPADRFWDRYDYQDAASNWNAPFARGSLPGSNNGMTLEQLIGYRTILVNTGTLEEEAMEEEDFALFRAWLESAACEANVNRQVFAMNGDGAGEIMEGWSEHGAPFLQEVLGATLTCDAFNGYGGPDCGPQNLSYCVRLLGAAGGPFGVEGEVDAFGNACPGLNRFDVFSPQAGAVGNRIYHAEDGLKDASFTQIVNEDLGANGNYRAILDGVSWHHMTRRDPGGDDLGLCPRDLPSVVDGIAAEIGAALRWGHDAADNGALPKVTLAEGILACQGTQALPAGVAEGGGPSITHLYGSEPNPFNPRTTIRFSLAQAGPVRILIYDVNGRLVRTLVDGKRDAGTHSAVWDGTNDAGHKIGSGVYWSQMKAGSYVSSKKMVVLK